MRVGGLLLLAALATGCATPRPAPGFPVAVPPSFAARDKAIAIVGDLQMTPRFVRTVMRRESNGHAQQRLLEDLHARTDQLALLAIVGDLVFTAKSRRDWRHFDRLVAPIASHMPVLPAIGNHDYHCALVRSCRQDEIPRQFLERFPWFAPGKPYVVAYGDIALVFLDSETAIAAQGDWLRAWLRASEQEFEWALVLLHRPPYTDSLLPGVAPDPVLQEQIVAALAGTSLVPVVISGHAHGYEHLVVDGIHFVVTAGGGGPRGPLAADRPNDVYGGRDCERDARARVLRPFNYLMVRPAADRLTVSVRGFCKADATVDVLESFEIPRRLDR